MGKLALVILSTPRVCRDQVSCSQSQKCVFLLISLPRGFSVSLIFARTQLLESLVFLFGFSVLLFRCPLLWLYSLHARSPGFLVSIPGAQCPGIWLLPRHAHLLSWAATWGNSELTSCVHSVGTCPLLTDIRYLESSCFMYSVSFLAVSDSKSGPCSPIFFRTPHCFL